MDKLTEDFMKLFADMGVKFVDINTGEEIKVEGAEDTV